LLCFIELKSVKKPGVYAVGAYFYPYGPEAAGTSACICCAVFVYIYPVVYVATFKMNTNIIFLLHNCDSLY